MEFLKNKYYHALEARQRIEPSFFIQDLQHIQNIGRLYKNMRRFARNYLGNFETSSMAKIWIASTTLVRIFKDDLQELMEVLKLYKKAYDVYFDKNIRLLLLYIDEFETKLQEIKQLLRMSQSAVESQNGRVANYSSYYKLLKEDMVMKGTLARENFDLFHRILSDHSILGRIVGTSNPELLKYLPKNISIAIEGRSCLNKLEGLKNQIGILVSFFGDTPTMADFQRADNQTTFDSRLENYRRPADDVSSCLAEYDQNLKDILEWKRKAEKQAKEFIDETPFHGVVFNFTRESQIIENDEREVEEILAKYAYARISKRTYLKHFDPAEQTSTVTSHVNNFVDHIKFRLTDPLRQRIQKIHQALQTAYEQAFLQVSAFEPHMDPHTFYIESKTMTIWRIPIPNMENPDRHNDRAREYWKVWNHDMDLKTFAETEASQYIAEGLNAFTEPLMETLDGFENQLIQNKEDLLAAMEDVHTEMENFEKKRLINHEFVL